MVGLLLLILAALPSDAKAQPAACQFRLGFRALHDLIPAIVGDCLEDERHSPDTGDALQRTTNGLLVWRNADNWTAFTDGSTTWLNGPAGVQRRPNAGPLFPWEGAGGSIGGIEGQAVAGPTCPVERIDRPCPDRPYQATVTVSDRAGRFVTRFQTDADGRFRVPLAPGTYRLEPESPGILPRAAELTVTVREGQFTTVLIKYDTGIR